MLSEEKQRILQDLREEMQTIASKMDAETRREIEADRAYDERVYRRITAITDDEWER